MQPTWRGWRHFDPTAPAREEGYLFVLPGTMERLSLLAYNYIDMPRTRLARYVMTGAPQIAVEVPGWIIAVAAAVLLASFYPVIRTAIRAVRTRKARTREEYAALLYRRVLAFVSARTLPYRSHLTPAEYISMVREHGGLGKEACNVFHDCTVLFCEIAYGPGADMDTRDRFHSNCDRILSSPAKK